MLLIEMVGVVVIALDALFGLADVMQADVGDGVFDPDHIHAERIEGSSEVVKNPMLDRLAAIKLGDLRIQRLLRIGPSGKAALSAAAKDKLALLSALDDLAEN